MRDERRRAEVLLAGRYLLASSTCFACSRLQRRNSTMEDDRRKPSEEVPLFSVSGMSMMISRGIVSALPEEGRGGGTCRLFIGVLSMIMSRGIIVIMQSTLALACLAESTVPSDRVGTRMGTVYTKPVRMKPSCLRVRIPAAETAETRNFRHTSPIVL